MGQINLFASKLTDNMAAFVQGYKEGALWKVVMSRVLDEREFPHAYAVEDNVQHNYILIEVADPLIYDDVNWLYRCIVTNEWEYNKKAVLRYAIERTLNKPGTRVIRRKVETDAEWERVKEFRRLLEAPAMAFRHFCRSYRDKNKHLLVEKIGNVLVIEYEGTNDELGREEVRTRVLETETAQ